MTAVVSGHDGLGSREPYPGVESLCDGIVSHADHLHADVGGVEALEGVGVGAACHLDLEGFGALPDDLVFVDFVAEQPEQVLGVAPPRGFCYLGPPLPCPVVLPVGYRVEYPLAVLVHEETGGRDQQQASVEYLVCHVLANR